MWLRKAGPSANATITAASSTASTKPRRRRAMEQELLRPVYGLLDDRQPTSLFGTHKHTLLAKTQSLILTLPLLDLALLDESLFYTLLHIVAQSYPKLEHPELQRDDDWVLFHDQQRIWSLEKRLSLQDHFHGKSCRGLGLVGLNDATCAIHGPNLPSPRGYLVNSHRHHPQQPQQSHRSLYPQHLHRKKKVKDGDVSVVDKESLDEGVEIPLPITIAAVEEESVRREGGEEEEGGVTLSVAAASHSVDHDAQEEGGEGEGGGVDFYEEDENKEQLQLPQPSPQDETEKVVHSPTKASNEHTGKTSKRPFQKKRIPMFSKGNGTGTGTASGSATSREQHDDNLDNPYNLRAGYLISQLIDRVNHGEQVQLDYHNTSNNHQQKR